MASLPNRSLNNVKKLNCFSQNKATEPADLYSAFDLALEQSNSTLLRGLKVGDIMRTWESGDWYPVVNATRNYDTGEITFEQGVFTLYGSHPQFDALLWSIPINLVMNSRDVEAYSNTKAEYWLIEKKLTPNKTFFREGWMIVNKQATGYYRVNYDSTNWYRLIFFLMTPDFGKIHVLNRAQLISDSFALARYGQLSYNVPFSLITYLAQETSAVPFNVFFDDLDFLDKCLSGSDIYLQFQHYILGILEGIRNHLGFEEKESEDYLDKINRKNVIKWLCKYEHVGCRAYTLNNLKNWHSNGTLIGVSPYALEAVLCGGIQAGRQHEWNFLFEKYQNEKDRQKRSQVLNALACSDDEKIILGFLEIIKDLNSTEMEERERTEALVAILKSGEVGKTIATTYIRQNVREIWQLGTMRTDILVNIGFRTSTREGLNYLIGFSKDGIARTAFIPAIVAAEGNVKWNEKHLSKIRGWFGQGSIERKIKNMLENKNN